MNAPNQRPTANKIYDILYFWWNSIKSYCMSVEKYGYHTKEINKVFDREIPTISLFANQEYQREYKSQLISISSESINYKICFNCYKPFIDKPWCDPYCKGWTSGNPDIDEFIKYSMYNAKEGKIFLEWVPFDRCTDIKQIDEGGFAKIYTATWSNMKVTLKRLNGSQNISTEYLNKVYFILYVLYFNLII